jgi:hypothetical protein
MAMPDVRMRRPVLMQSLCSGAKLCGNIQMLAWEKETEAGTDILMYSRKYLGDL